MSEVEADRGDMVVELAGKSARFYEVQLRGKRKFSGDSDRSSGRVKLSLWFVQELAYVL